MSLTENDIKSLLVNLNFETIDGFRIDNNYIDLIKIFKGEIQLTLKIPVQFRNFKDEIQTRCEKELLKFEGMKGVVVEIGTLVETTEKPQKSKSIPALENVSNIIAVCSGKGGVGKSTVTANLAAAFSEMGFKLDCAVDFGAASGCSGCGTTNNCG